MLRFAAGFFFSGPADRIEARIDEMLELVRIADKAHRPIKTLSGGGIQSRESLRPRFPNLIC
jgi:energy-coupling factor transporter ATP-binding protein EcfA2